LLDFRPPKDSPLLIFLAKCFMPLITTVHLHDTRLEVVGDGLERFKALRGKRTVICPNHPNRNDPEIMMAFSCLVGEDFNFLAAREVFDWNHGMRGWWFQHLGVYSVVRGAVDRESFKTTKHLIVQGKKKLVIFPEGEISKQNDTLMVLESGVAQMAFWALDELQKTASNEPVYLLPMANKYVYRGDIRSKLETALWRLEDRLGIKAGDINALYPRLRGVAEELLRSMEIEYDYKPPKDATLNDRINGLRAFILQTIAGFLQVQLPADERQLDWIRIIRNELDEFIYADDSEMSDYHRKVKEERAAKIKGFYRDLDRVVNFIAIYDGYLRDHMTQERFADVIDRFELEVFGETTSKGPRTVMMDVGRAINLAELYTSYKTNKKVTIRQVNEELTSQIASMLETLERKRTPLFVN
jgi:hypothetical protein